MSVRSGGVSQRSIATVLSDDLWNTEGFVERTVMILTATKSIMVTAITSVSVCSILYVIFVIYLGVYAYANPDPVHAFYVDGLETPGITKETAQQLAIDRGIEVRSGYPLDMAHLFRSWFMWGFWGSII